MFYYKGYKKPSLPEILNQNNDETSQESEVMSQDKMSAQKNLAFTAFCEFSSGESTSGIHSLTS